MFWHSVAFCADDGECALWPYGIEKLVAEVDSFLLLSAVGDCRKSCANSHAYDRHDCVGPDFAIGKNPLTDPSWFHIIAGLLVFAVAIGGMVGIAKILTDFSSIRAWVVMAFQSLRASARPAYAPSGLRPPPPPADPSRKKTEEDY